MKSFQEYKPPLFFHAEIAETAETMRPQDKYEWNYAERTHFACALPSGWLHTSEAKYVFA